MTLLRLPCVVARCRVLATILGVCGFASGCREEIVEPLPPRPVRAIQIADSPALTSRTFPGTAEAVDAVELSFRVSGPLIAFPANELGKQVAPGDLLAQIAPRDYEVRVRDARAALAKATSEMDAMRKARPEDIVKLQAEVDRAAAAAEYARAEHNRNLILRQSNAVSISETELSGARAKLADAELVQATESLRIGQEGARPEDIAAKQSQIDSLQATLDSAQDELSYTRLTAPFGGSVAAVYVDNFQVVRTKQPVLRLVNTAELEIRIDVPEQLIALVPLVDETFVTIQAYPDQALPARIAEIGTEASATTRTYPVKLRFTAPPGIDVRPGMTGTVSGRRTTAVADETTGHVVPVSAVLDRDSRRSVWVFDPAAKVVRERDVTILGTTPFGVNVTGVEIGDWVVTAGAHYLTEDQQVRLLGPATKEAAP